LTLLRLILPAFATVLCLGCGPEGLEADPATPAAAPDVYVVRGEVVSLPGRDDPTRGFYVRHEAIDDFKGGDGAVLGMDAMTMRFPVDDPAVLEGIEVGDKVELTYEVNWHGEPMQRATRVLELPADTELVYRKARPPSAR
jgi:Cu/Ag efflux protein CusF